MKRKSISLWICILMCLMLFIAIGCTSNKSASFELAETKVWLDRYEETDISLIKGEISDLSCTPADEGIVTVKNGRIIAQGVGTTTISVSDGKGSATIEVVVNDSGVKPKIGFSEFNVYYNVPTEIPQYVNYAGEKMKTEIDYSITFEDSSFVSVDGNMLTGLKIGETQATLTSQWKGLSLSKTVTVCVKNPIYMSLDATEITLYNVDEKLGRADTGVHVYRFEEELTNANITYDVTSGDDCVRFENGMVYAKSEGQAMVTASFEEEGIVAECTFSVTVKPNYIETSFGKTTQPFDVTYEQHTGEIGGRTDDCMYEYRPETGVNSNTCWNNRIVSSDISTKIMELYRQGIRYFAYDLYYTSNENLMIGCHNYTSWISVNSYFRSDYLTIVADGEVINRLEKNRWVTLVYDFKALWSQLNIGLPANFFFFVNDDTTSQYIMNVRYYLDDDLLPDENLRYEDKGDYVQATNDEFDIRYPISTGYKKGSDTPSIVVTEDTIPTYEPYEEDVDGRTGAYKYTTQASGGITNSLVIAKSMNITYDDGMYRMSKLGSYLAYDIYVENNGNLTFRMNNLDTTATITTGETNLGRYEDWLIFIKDNKKQAILSVGEWYTVVVAFADNYDDDYSSSIISFSADDANMTVYVDNVRYYKTSNFIPTAYEDDKNAPYLTCEISEATVKKLTDGQFKASYEYVNKTSGEANSGLSFRGVTTAQNTADYFFTKGYKYVSFQMYVAENVSAITLRASAERNLTEYNVTIPVGTDFGDLAVYVFNMDETVATALSRNTWYTIYIPVQYDDSDVGNVYVQLCSKGGSDSEPAKMYLKYVSFEKAITEPTLKAHTSYTSVVSIKYQESGDFVGAYKYTNGNGGRYGTGSITYGESGVYFNEVYAGGTSFANQDWRFFTRGYQYVKFELYIDESVTTIDFRNGDRSMTTGWHTVDIGDNDSIQYTVLSWNSDVWMFYDVYGNRVTSLNHNAWYTVYLTPAQAYTSIQANGDNNPVMYFRNVEYLRELVLPFTPTLGVHTNYASQVSIEYQASGDFAGAFKYTNNHGGRYGTSATYGDAGAFFNEIHTGGMSWDNQPYQFFNEGYTQVKFDIYIEESVKTIDFRIDYSAGSAAWNTVDIGDNDSIQYTVLSWNSDVWTFYDAEGNQVNTLAHNTWYTVVVTPVQGKWFVVQSNGVGAVMYFRNMEYLKASA